MEAILDDKGAAALCRSAMAYLKFDFNASGAGTKAEDLLADIDQQPISRDLGNGIVVTYLVPSKLAMRYIQGRHLKDAGMTEDELHQIALSNFDLTPEKRIPC